MLQLAEVYYELGELIGVSVNALRPCFLLIQGALIEQRVRCDVL